MRTGRTIEIRSELVRLRTLLPAIAVSVVAIVLFGWVWLMNREASERFRALRTDYRELAAKVAASRAEGEKKEVIRAALDELSRKTARKEDLRSVFDPILSPGKGTGVKTEKVSYQSTALGDGLEIYAIRFSVAGRYPGIAGFLSNLEGGRSPAFIVDNVALKAAELPGGRISGEGAALVLVR